MNIIKRDTRPEGSAALTAIYSTGWFACTQQAIVACAAGYDVKISAGQTQAIRGIDLQNITLTKGE